jgi:hypothetical protein
MKRLLMKVRVRVFSRSWRFATATVGVFMIASFAGAGSGAAAPALANDPAGALAGSWHRLNPQQSQSNPVPEHERLQCERRADIDGGAWMCRYFKIPAPQLNFGWNNTTGRFVGSDVTPTWACPGWFPASICDNVVQVVEGTFVFDLSSGGQLTNLQDLVVTQAAGVQRLYAYRVVNQIACPWFRSFEEALAANPFPLPFNGVNGPALDCIIPPP